MSETENSGSNFIREIIDQDLEDGRFTEIHTRFPPEPNGYLHIGHAKSILLNYGIAQAYNGKFNLRFDDTNPVTEEVEFIESIQHDIRWLGVDWEDRLLFASDYFDQLYAYAIDLIKKGLAYVDDLNQEEIREYRGTLTEPGKESPYRNRSIEENLDLFERMKNGEFEEGSKVLRAKIDMSSPNMNFRDPLLYRIVYAHHPRTGDKWCIYPLYDWAHGQSDSIEQISHSICTLEFEDHRPLYNWFIEKLGIFHPRQIEFARFNLTHTVMSKRKLLQLVQDKHVNGWDDPRMPTIAGMRRRGYSSSALAAFMEKVGVAKANSTIDFALLEHVIRQEYEEKAQRAFAVIDPVKVVITNYPEDQEEEFDVKRWPQDEESTEIRKVPFSREIYIDRDDFMVDPPRKYFRLAPEREVRLMHAYYITCTDYVLNDETGEVKEIHCTYDPETRGGMSPDGRRVKGTIHWVSARHALDAELRLYDHLFLKENPYEAEEGKDFTSNINPDSLIITKNSKLEPALAAADPDDHYQFMRKGYFVVDEKDSKPDALVFNRTISLRDSWAKIQKKN